MTVNGGCDPRGAWDPDDLQRQQDKIVAAINALDADVVGLLEIENSADGDADEALGTLVDALNAAAGSTVWAYVPSSTGFRRRPSRTSSRTRLIYQAPAARRTDGETSRALGDQSTDDQAFGNAREPIGQVFTPVGGGAPFFVAVNHLKSKGSAGPWPDDADTGRRPGRVERVAEATGCRAARLGPDGPGRRPGGRAHRRLQRVHARGPAADPVRRRVHRRCHRARGRSVLVLVRGCPARSTTSCSTPRRCSRPQAPTSGRSTPRSPSPSSTTGTTTTAPCSTTTTSTGPRTMTRWSSGSSRVAAKPVTLTLLDINDFHGRIDANTVKFAGTVEKEKAAAVAADSPVAFVSAGDNISASLFASAVQQDQPTIDVLNALEPQRRRPWATTSSTRGSRPHRPRDRGRHQREVGLPRANVYLKGTTTPALPEYAILDMDGVSVAVIGAVTQETPSLVTPGGITELEFGDPVAAVNRVAAQLSDGDASTARPRCSSPATTRAQAGVCRTAPSKGARGRRRVQGHRRADLRGRRRDLHRPHPPAVRLGGTRSRRDRQDPADRADGSYGEFIGKVVLTFDPASGEVIATPSRTSRAWSHRSSPATPRRRTRRRSRRSSSRPTRGWRRSTPSSSGAGLRERRSAPSRSARSRPTSRPPSPAARTGRPGTRRR